MSTQNKLWTDVSTWTPTVGAASVSANDTTDWAGETAIKFTTSGKNKSNVNFIEISGTWETLFGIASGSTVTTIGTPDDNDWQCLTFTTGAASTAGPLELRDSSGTLLLTLATGSAYSGTTTRATKAGTSQAVPGAQQASNTTIRLRLNATMATGNSNSAVNALILGHVNVTITYTGPVLVSDSESATLVEIMPGPELRVTEASTAMEVLAQTDFSVVALGSLAESAGFSTPSTDSASAAESSTLAVGPVGNDAGTLAESSTQPATVAGADTGALAESGSIAATLSDSDSAILPPGQVNEADLPRDADAGTLADTASSTVTTASTDAGTLAETPALAVASSDAGTLAETSQVTTGAVAKTDTDTGTEAESAAIGITPTGEALTQSDTGLVTATLPASDSGALAETSAIVQQGTHPADSETGTLVDSGTVTAIAFGASDVGSLADAGTAVITKLFLADADAGALTETGAVVAASTHPTDTESAALVETATLSQAQVGVSAPPSNIGGGGFGAILRRIKERKDDDIEVIWAELLPQKELSAAPADDTEIAPEEHAARTALPTPARLRPRVRVRLRHAPVAFELAGTSWAPEDDLARQVTEDNELVALLALV